MDSRGAAMYRQKSVSPGTVGRLVFFVAFALRVIGGSISTPSYSSMSSNFIAFPNCTGTISGIGNGACEYQNNNVVRAFATASTGHEIWDTTTPDYSYILRSIVYGISNIHLLTGIVHNDRIDPQL